MQPDQKTSAPALAPEPKRPLLLTILCLSGFVFFGIIALLFLASLFWSGRIAGVMNQYTPEDSYSHLQMIFLTLSAFCIHAVSFYGIILIWRLRKQGYYLFSLPVLVLSAYQSFNDRFSLTSVAIYIGFVVLFGLFYRKLR